jgi:hypothetical protein
MCTNQECEYKPTLQTEALKRTHDEIRYGELWAEIELPRLLIEEVKQ